MGKRKQLDDGDTMKRIKNFLLLIGILLFVHGCATFGTETKISRKHLKNGLAHEKNENYQQAIDHYTKAANSGYHDEAYVYIGNTYHRMKAFNQAENHYQIAIEKLPNHADLHHNLAYLYLRQGIHLNKAEKLALRAIKLNEESDHINRYRSTLKKIRDLSSENRQLQSSNDQRTNPSVTSDSPTLKTSISD